ncbi:Ig-like domain-containing protein [uncultured Nocardioides sp.]|uniref:Ig-like domain-containing protein n=1 Tax=uncultured Nocardioides sp. TaxID=198441 RepID=UPI002616DD73|nr:Ig-like domain-containing protein [uncultured Nocardioides sp.]
MKKLAMSIATTAVAAGLIAPGPAGATAAAWNDGFQDQDTIIDCITSTTSVGVSANIGWSSPSGQVPKVGEKFYIRGYAGLVGLPCSGKVAILPELLAPTGVEYVDEDVQWDVYHTGEQPSFASGGLDFDHGANGGYLMAPAGTEAFTLRQGDIVEFRFPVRATRELKGPATQQPNCQSRLDGDAPCPISQAGDHMQIAYTVGGHGGDKYYVTPYVGLFASNAQTTPTPTTPIPTTPTPTTPTPTTPTTPAPDPGPGAGKVASTTSATWKVVPGRRGKVAVTVKAAVAATGTVVVRDKGKVVAQATLSPSRRGKVTVRLPKLRRGKHKLVAAYLGSPDVAASASRQRTITLR